MKLVKMSLAAAMVMSASAFAIDNVKVSGDAKLYYSTTDEGDASLLHKDGAAADVALRLGVTGDLLKGVSFGLTGNAVSTLGLENNLVSGVWSGGHTVTPGNGSNFGASVDDENWMSEAWLATTVGKTTVKAGRMELDTPLVFSEKWNVAANTFEGVVVMNQDIQDTTLVAGWVGKSNGSSTVPAVAAGPSGIARGVVNAAGEFGTFRTDGAYAFGVVNNSFKPLVFQGWYYDVVSVAKAYWLQADWACQLNSDIKVGVQYTNNDDAGDHSAFAVKVGYEGIQNLKLSAAFSSTGEDAGMATANLAGAQSKLYTEAVWVDSFGKVGAADTQAWNAKASYDVKDLAKFCASYTSADNGAAGNTGDMQEIVLSATKSFGALDTRLALINTELNGGDAYNTVNAYLTLNF